MGLAILLNIRAGTNADKIFCSSRFVLIYCMLLNLLKLSRVVKGALLNPCHAEVPAEVYFVKPKNVLTIEPAVQILNCD